VGNWNERPEAIMNDQASPALPPVVDRNAWQAAREALRALIAYFHALWPGLPAAEQCEGCTFFNSQVCELSYIHSRNVTYAVLCKGAYEESIRYRDFLGLQMPWYSAEKTAAQLLERRDWQRHHLVCSSATATGCSRLTTPAPWGRDHGPHPRALDMTVYGRQKTWEDAPRRLAPTTGDAKKPQVWRINGRPIAQWSRVETGRSDDLT
jgi:hypothetical protein